MELCGNILSINHFNGNGQNYYVLMLWFFGDSGVMKVDVIVFSAALVCL